MGCGHSACFSLDSSLFCNTTLFGIILYRTMSVCILLSTSLHYFNQAQWKNRNVWVHAGQMRSLSEAGICPFHLRHADVVYHSSSILWPRSSSLSYRTQQRPQYLRSIPLRLSQYIVTVT
jgi:hypothetical protein